LADERAVDRTAPAEAAETVPAEPVEPAPADRQEAPASADGWRAVVSDLYQRRAHAFATARPDGFADVYTPGSPQLAADEDSARALGEAGEALRGFAPEIVTVSVRSSGGARVQLDLVDRWRDYDVVPAGAPAGPTLRTVPGRPDTSVRMVLVRTGDGWRIESGQRLG
jgi:hypothetical protein